MNGPRNRDCMSHVIMTLVNAVVTVGRNILLSWLKSCLELRNWDFVKYSGYEVSRVTKMSSKCTRTHFLVAGGGEESDIKILAINNKIFKDMVEPKSVIYMNDYDTTDRTVCPSALNFSRTSPGWLLVEGET